MTRIRRHRRTLLRWLTCLSLVLALIVQPTLAAVGELHELGHGLEEAHLATAECGSVSAEIAAHQENGDHAAGALHVVHHFAHCCGQTAAPALGSLLDFNAPPPTRLAADWLITRPTSAPVLAPFRPPIAA